MPANLAHAAGVAEVKRLPLWEKLYKKGDKEDGMMYGTIRIKLAERLQVSGMSKNKLGQKAEMQRTQINHYCSNRITRLDTNVLARLCTALNCTVGDLLEYIPPENS